MDLAQQILDKIKESESIAIAIHDSPDADCIGSAFALKRSLIKNNKNVDVILQNKISNVYSKIIGNENTGKTVLPSKSYDLLIILDCSTEDRTIPNIKRYADFVIAIDHHIGYKPYGDLYLCKDESCTGIILYDIIKQLTGIDEYIANCLYLTIVGDTNNFKNNNVNSYTHVVAGELLKCGADLKAVNNSFQKPTLSLMRLMGQTFSDIHYDKHYNICYLMVKYEHIKLANSTYEEASSLIEYIRNVEDCDVVFLFLQNRNTIRVKARSKNTDVSKIMQEFGGGGHKHAAGAEMYSDEPYSTINRVLQVTREYLK